MGTLNSKLAMGISIIFAFALTVILFWNGTVVVYDVPEPVQLQVILHIAEVSFSDAKSYQGGSETSGGNSVAAKKTGYYSNSSWGAHGYWVTTSGEVGYQTVHAIAGM